MSAILIALLIVVYTMQSLLCRKYSEYYPGEEKTASPVFTVVSGLIVAVVSYAFTGFSFEASGLTISLGIVNALVLFAYNTCMIKASQNGPYSILMVFMIAGGIVFPTIIAAVGFREEVSFGRCFSIAVLLTAVYMTSRKTDDTSFKNKSGFVLGCIGLALFNGAYGALLDVQQRLTSPLEKEEMVAVTYFFAMLFSMMVLFMKQRKEVITSFKQTKRSCAYLLACSVTVALAVNLMVYILPIVNVTVLYTFDNSGVFLVSVLISRIFFQEKMSVLNWSGCVLMCLALIRVSIL